MALSPILTRLYTPEEFGLMGLYIAITSIIVVIATARYELAIIQPRSTIDVDNLAILSITVAFFISLISLVFVSVFNKEICQLVGNDDISPWLYFVPLTVFFMGVSKSLNYWYNRNKRYFDLSKAKVYQSGANVSANLLLASMNAKAFGLIFGYIFSQLFHAYILIKLLISEKLLFKKGVSVARCIVLAKRYSKFPRYSMPGAILDSVSLQMPILFLSRFFDADAVGFFSFTFRIISGPMGLISGALAQVLLQKIATEDHSNVYGLILLALRKLTLAAIPFVLVVYFLGEHIFAFVFGEQWIVAGQYATILIFSIAIRFIVSPLSMVLALDKNIKLGMVWQFLYFISVISVLTLSKNLPVKDFLLAFVVQDVLLYILYLIFILGAAKRMEKCVG